MTPTEDLRRLRTACRLFTTPRMLLAALLAALASAPLHAAGEHGHHHDQPLAVASGSVSLRAEPDPAGGWNVQVQTEAFRFAPEHVNQAHVPGEGHAHVYLNGEKIRRIYGPWFHLDPLPPGEHELKVTLNANSHQALQVDGRPLEARTTLQQPAR